MREIDLKPGWLKSALRDATWREKIITACTDPLATLASVEGLIKKLRAEGEANDGNG